MPMHIDLTMVLRNEVRRSDLLWFIKANGVHHSSLFLKIRARGYKICFMLNSVEHEILNAHKYKNITKLSFFQTQISRECYFSCSYKC